MVLRTGPWGAGFAGLFGAAVVARRMAYDRGLLRTFRPAVPTISVGGLEAGGSGKTPVAELVLKALVQAGRAPGLLTRGYARASSGLVLRMQGEKADPDQLGDEPAMLVESGIDVPVAACVRREEGAKALVAGGCDCLVLDDGFSHRALARDTDIVVLRGEAPWGNGHLLPWGTLREPASSLCRAHVIWLHFRHQASPGKPAWCAELCPQAAVVTSQAEPRGPYDESGGCVALRNRRVVAASGIARPEDFFATLTRLGGVLVGRRSYRDHHRFAAKDAAELAELAHRLGAEAVVVTPKDAIKLVRVWRGRPLWVLGTKVRVCGGGEALANALGISGDALPGSCLSHGMP